MLINCVAGRVDKSCQIGHPIHREAANQVQRKLANKTKKTTEKIAGIMFKRIAAQMGGMDVSESQWDLAYRGWIENPALFPLVEACLDAALEIEAKLKTTSSGQPGQE